MPTLQVRDLPDEVYTQLTYLAKKEHRSLSQETIAVLKEGITARLESKDRRRALLEQDAPLNIDGSKLTDPVNFIREDRER